MIAPTSTPSSRPSGPGDPPRRPHPVHVFLDASALIYLVEGRPPFAAGVRTAVQALQADQGPLQAAVSRLTWLECRVGPLRSGDVGVLAAYDDFFARPDLVWVELDQDVVALATAIRARERLRTPDALQAACCLQLGPRHVMLTGDAAFGCVPGLNVRVV